MSVLIDQEMADSGAIDPEDLKDLAQEILHHCGHGESELSILLVEDPRMRELNNQYRQKDKTTNVLSFPMQDGPEIPTGSMLGDVVISLDTAAREAEEKQVSLQQRTVRLLVHGVVHLLGFDHERSEIEATQMLTEEERIMGLITARIY